MPDHQAIVGLHGSNAMIDVMAATEAVVAAADKTVAGMSMEELLLAGIAAVASTVGLMWKVGRAQTKKIEAIYEAQLLKCQAEREALRAKIDGLYGQLLEAGKVPDRRRDGPTTGG